MVYGEEGQRPTQEDVLAVTGDGAHARVRSKVQPDPGSAASGPTQGRPR